MTNDTTQPLPALGICLEEYEYPYPVQFFSLTCDLQTLKMAFMDVPPDGEPNGQAVVLFHGKAFGCYYFLNVIQALTAAGYRVVAPDQVGWGKSPSPISTTASSYWRPTPPPCSTTWAWVASPSSATRPAA
jgi:pimeloyl-ACP methyl ester carboxylesterase